MIIVIDDAGVHLDASEDFTRFDVHASVSPDEWEPALVRAQAGKLIGDRQVAIFPAWIIAAAGELAFTTQWQNGFAGMLAYARSKQWVAEDGTILAHIVK